MNDPKQTATVTATTESPSEPKDGQLADEALDGVAAGIRASVAVATRRSDEDQSTGAGVGG